jgi:hypothetical protein
MYTIKTNRNAPYRGCAKAQRLVGMRGCEDAIEGAFSKKPPQTPQKRFIKK